MFNWKKYLPGNGYWTGRSSLYKNQNQVDYVLGQFESIKNSVPAAQAEATAALSKLNLALANTGYSIDTSAFTQTYTWVSDKIQTLHDQISDKKTSADEFAKQSAEHPFKTVFATGGMVISNFAEGVTSAFEDIGDGVATLTVGWGSKAIDGITNWVSGGKGTHWNDKVSDFIARDLSDELFDNINSATGITKYSAITEDSGFANLSKTAGVATGYIVISAATMGAGSAMATTAAAGSKAAAIGSFLSSSTTANTIMAAIGGYGSGTENGLQSGHSFVQAATRDGGKQALIQGGTAYAMGKLGEHIEKGRQVKNAQKHVDRYTEKLNTAKETLKETGEGYVDVAKAEGRLVKAQNRLDTIKNTKIGFKGSTKFQGYNDKITKTVSDHVERGMTSALEQEGKVTLGTVTKAAAKTAWNDIKSIPSNAASTFKNASGEVTKASVAKGVVKAATAPVTAPVKIVASEVASGVSTLGVGGKTTAATIARDLIGAGVGTKVTHNNTNTTELHNFNLRTKQTPITDSLPSSEEFGIGNSSDQFIPKKPSGGDTSNDSSQPNDSTPSANDNSNSDTTTGDNSYNGGSSYIGGSSYTGGSSSPGTSTTGAGTTSAESSKAQLKSVEEETPKTTKEASTSSTSTPSTSPASSTPSTSSSPSPATVPTTGSGTTYHTGGGYSGAGYYSSNPDTTTPADGTSDLSPLDESLISSTSSIDEIIKGSKYTKIPTSSKPITTSQTSSSGTSSVIPVAAGLSAAAAAGIGAKAYMDRKRNNETGDEEDDDFDTEEWNGDDDSIDISYDENVDQEYFDDEDDYSYQEEDTEKYGARNNEELADLQ